MKMKKILLIPAINISRGQIDPYIPYGLLSLQAAAHRHGSGKEVDILPTSGDLLEMKFRNSTELAEALLAQIDLQDYDTVGLSTMCNSFHHSLRIASVIKQQVPGIRVWMGGAHVSVIARQVLEAFKEVDGVFVGEGELTFAEVLNCRTQGDYELKNVPGVHTREYTYAPRKSIPNLDELHWIDLAEHYPVSLSQLLEWKKNIDVPLEAARGCPGYCSFCSTHLYWGRQIRRKSAERLISEMYRLYDLTGISNFNLISDTFGAPRRRLLQFCKTICSEAHELQWNCSLRLDDLEEEDLETLWQGGCRKFFVGVESASLETLKRIHKNVLLERNLNIISNAVQMGFKVITSFIIGFPWETSDSIDRTFKLHCRMLELGVHRSQVHLLCPLPGTELSKKHPVHFDHFISDIAQDDIPMDNTTRELIHLYPGMFSQLGYYETPHVNRNELVAIRDAASQLYHLYSMKDTNTTPVKLQSQIACCKQKAENDKLLSQQIATGAKNLQAWA